MKIQYIFDLGPCIAGKFSTNFLVSGRNISQYIRTQLPDRILGLKVDIS